MVMPTSNPSYTEGWDRRSVNSWSAWATPEEPTSTQRLNPKWSRPFPMLSAESSILGLILYLTSNILPDSMCLSWWSWAEHHQLKPSATTICQCPCSCYKWLMLLLLLLIHLAFGHRHLLDGNSRAFFVLAQEKELHASWVREQGSHITCSLLIGREKLYWLQLAWESRSPTYRNH